MACSCNGPAPPFELSLLPSHSAWRQVVDLNPKDMRVHAMVGRRTDIQHTIGVCPTREDFQRGAFGTLPSCWSIRFGQGNDVWLCG